MWAPQELPEHTCSEMGLAGRRFLGLSSKQAQGLVCWEGLLDLSKESKKLC